MEKTIPSIDELLLAREGEQFLLSEGEILDAGDYQKWLTLLCEDIVYQIPLRTTRERNGRSPFSSASYHMNEDKSSLEMRVARVYTDYNFVEDPPSRSRHYLTNFRIVEINRLKDEMVMKCNMLIYRSKFDFASHEFLSGEREDVLRKEGGEWKLAKRTVYLDHTTMGVSNLAIFL
ncbi:aromatic-ring-hydroxylating dioxygenase subunit beta [Mesobacillus foraminis]|uniref:aromatic-ring-hydroxylating dioxygenase subunit beta n=1 Tax=Mesobacillus foraminis TaxID=279826 RepID=UPI000EF4DE7B|nr:3-phenylpropionate/cinnamic acid dioxygenase subunit beta [Mesobacillus foraminis]